MFRKWQAAKKFKILVKKIRLYKRLFGSQVMDVIFDVAGIIILMMWLQVKFSAGIFIPGNYGIKKIFNIHIDTCSKSNGRNQVTFTINDSLTLQGHFSIILNPTLSNGSIDLSHSLSMTGQFNIPYHYIP